MRYTIYCDESEHKGRFYGNFYGGAILATSDQEAITAELEACKANAGLKGEAKWTKIGPYNEASYKQLVDKIFELIGANKLKLRVMFTQNINQVAHVEEYKDNNEFYLLYYQFIKHAFGLRFCNPSFVEDVHLAVLIDDAPDKSEALGNFKDYLSSLSAFPVFFRNRIHPKWTYRK